MRLMLAILGLAAVSHPAAAQSAASRVAPQNGWHATLESAKAEAKKSGKPLMVVFRCDP
jgi:ABC-type sugar transport system substrate-binding protein